MCKSDLLGLKKANLLWAEGAFSCTRTSILQPPQLEDMPCINLQIGLNPGSQRYNWLTTKELQLSCKKAILPSIFQPYHWVLNVTLASKLWKKRIKHFMFFLFLSVVIHLSIFWRLTHGGWIYGANSAGVFSLHNGAKKCLVGAWKAIASSSIWDFLWGELGGLKRNRFFLPLVLVCESLLSTWIRPVFIEFPPVTEIYGMINRRCTQRVERVA